MDRIERERVYGWVCLSFFVLTRRRVKFGVRDDSIKILIAIP